MSADLRQLIQDRAGVSSSARTALRVLSVAWWSCNAKGTVIESDGPGLDLLIPPRKPNELAGANIWRDWPEYIGYTPFAQVADVLRGGAGGSGVYEADGRQWLARVVPAVVDGGIGALCVTLPLPGDGPWTSQ